MGDLAVAFGAMVLVRVVVFYFEMSSAAAMVVFGSSIRSGNGHSAFSHFTIPIFTAIDQTLSLRELCFA